MLNPFWISCFPVLNPVDASTAEAVCDTKPTTIRTGLFGWRECPGCPEFVECLAPPPPPCCHLSNQPVECAAEKSSTNKCICCSDGKWVVTANDNVSTTGADEVCGYLGLQVGAECQYYGCTKDLFPCPDGTSVGRDFTSPDCPFDPCPGE
jgi:hypothetical protein